MGISKLVTRRENILAAGAPAIGGRVRYAPGNGGVGELFVGGSSYAPHGKGARVNFTVVDSAFGRILIAATGTGVCWIGLCSSEARLEGELRADLPASTIVRDDTGMAGIARSIADYAGGSTCEIVLPIDIRATPFQIAVWRELCGIPSGATRTYGEIARRLGRPDAARAVGHANGSNPLAIVIPCHRAIGADGSLTGYRWGLEYKRRLLDHECALAQSSLFAD